VLAASPPTAHAWRSCEGHGNNGETLRARLPSTFLNFSFTVPKVFQIGLCGVVEANLELFWICCSAGFFGERLYVQAGNLPAGPVCMRGPRLKS